MRKLITISMMTAFVSMSAQGHDEGHGPKVSDTGKYGGLVSAVVSKSEAEKGTKAALVHKAELVRSTDGSARVYLYDTAMKPLDLKTLNSKATGILAVKVKGKWKDKEFLLEQKDNVFIGKMPKPDNKPYNIDVTFKEGSKELLSAFENLD